MSTATEITRLTSARNTIRNKMVNLGLGTSTDLLDDLATEIDAISNQGAVSATVQEGDTYTIPAGYHNGSGTVSGVAGGGNYTLQSKGPITPTKSAQSITADNGYYGLSGVSIAAIPEAYQDVQSVTATASDVLANKVIVESDGTVTAGTMPNNGAVSKTLDATTSNQSYTVPAGYHNGSGTVQIVLETKSTTPTKSSQDITPTAGKVLSKVTVAAIPAAYQDVSNVDATADDVLYGKTIVLANGTEVEGTIPSKDSTDLTISDGTVTAPAGYYDEAASLTLATIVGSTAITGTKKVTPSISRTSTAATGATNVGSGTASTSAPSSGYFVSVQSEANTGTLTATPSVTTAGYGTAANHGIAGNTETVGANASAVTYITVPGGSATTPDTSITADPSISVSSGGLITATVSASESVTPTVSTGYVTSGTAGNISVSGSKTSQLTVQAAQTIYPSSSDQSISSGKYLTGAQTFKAVKLANLSAANIKDGAVVKVGDVDDDDRVTSVTGTFTDASTVSSGQTAATAGQILAGYSAWVDGAEVQGSVVNIGAISGTIDGLTTTSYSISAGYTAGGTVSLTNDIETALAAI